MKKIYYRIIFSLLILISITNFSYSMHSKEGEQYRRKDAKGYVVNAIRHCYQEFLERNELLRLKNNITLLKNFECILTDKLKDDWEMLRCRIPSIRINLFILFNSGECLQYTLFDYRYHSSKKANLKKRLIKKEIPSLPSLNESLINIENTIQNFIIQNIKKSRNPRNIRNLEITIEKYDPDFKKFTKLNTIDLSGDFHDPTKYDLSIYDSEYEEEEYDEIDILADEYEEKLYLKKNGK